MVKCSTVMQRGIADARGEVFNRKAKGNCCCALMLAGRISSCNSTRFHGFHPSGCDPSHTQQRKLLVGTWAL